MLFVLVNRHPFYTECCDSEPATPQIKDLIQFNNWCLGTDGASYNLFELYKYHGQYRKGKQSSNRCCQAIAGVQNLVEISCIYLTYHTNHI